MRKVFRMIFAGGIGEHDSRSREAILAGSEGLGFFIDKSLNEKKASGLRRISTADSATGLFVVPAQEDLMIARHVERLDRQLG